MAKSKPRKPGRPKSKLSRTESFQKRSQKLFDKILRDFCEQEAETWQSRGFKPSPDYRLGFEHGVLKGRSAFEHYLHDVVTYDLVPAKEIKYLLKLRAEWKQEFPNDLVRHYRSPPFPRKKVNKFSLLVDSFTDFLYPEIAAKRMKMSVPKVSELFEEAVRLGFRVALGRDPRGREFFKRK
jgi:hypothetical protein